MIEILVAKQNPIICLEIPDNVETLEILEIGEKTPLVMTTSPFHLTESNSPVKSIKLPHSSFGALMQKSTKSLLPRCIPSFAPAQTSFTPAQRGIKHHSEVIHAWEPCTPTPSHMHPIP